MNIGLLAKPIISDNNLSVINKILCDRNFNISLAILDIRPKLSLKQKIVKNIKRGRGGYIVVMFFKSFFTKKEKRYFIKDFCHKAGIDILETISPYSIETISKIKDYNLDVLLLINGFGIIKKELLSITPKGILSYHHGNMRKYRGMPPAFWELYNNEKEIGVTVQKLEVGLDCGTPVEEMSFPILNSDTLGSLVERIYNGSTEMMHSALIKISSPDFKPQKIEQIGKIYTLPNFRQWLYLNTILVFRRFLNIR